MYKEVCDITLRLKDSRDVLIRKTVVSIIPTLALYDPATFSELYLHKSMSHLLNLLRKNSEKRDGKNEITYSGLQKKILIFCIYQLLLLSVKWLSKSRVT